MECFLCGKDHDRLTKHHYYWVNSKAPKLLRDFVLKIDSRCHKNYNKFFFHNCINTNFCLENCKFKMICCYYEVRKISLIINPKEVILPYELFENHITLLVAIVYRTITKFETEGKTVYLPENFQNRKIFTNMHHFLTAEIRKTNLKEAMYSNNQSHLEQLGFISSL